MTREDIIRMAQECGINAESDTLCRHEGWVEPLEQFAIRIVASLDPKSWMTYGIGFEAGRFAGAAAEREECAKVCDLAEKANSYQGNHSTISSCAKAIRARGEK